MSISLSSSNKLQFVKIYQSPKDHPTFGWKLAIDRPRTLGVKGCITYINAEDDDIYILRPDTATKPNRNNQKAGPKLRG